MCACTRCSVPLPFITPKRAASSGAHLRDLAPGQHIYEETSQRWRIIGNTVSDLTDLVIEPQIYRTDSNVMKIELIGYWVI